MNNSIWIEMAVWQLKMVAVPGDPALLRKNNRTARQFAHTNPARTAAFRIDAERSGLSPDARIHELWELGDSTELLPLNVRWQVIAEHCPKKGGSIASTANDAVHPLEGAFSIVMVGSAACAIYLLRTTCGIPQKDEAGRHAVQAEAVSGNL